VRGEGRGELIEDVGARVGAGVKDTCHSFSAYESSENRGEHECEGVEGIHGNGFPVAIEEFQWRGACQRDMKFDKIVLLGT